MCKVVPQIFALRHAPTVDNLHRTSNILTPIAQQPNDQRSDLLRPPLPRDLDLIIALLPPDSYTFSMHLRINDTPAQR